MRWPGARTSPSSARSTRFCQQFPQRRATDHPPVNAKQLPEGYPVDEHFNPPYNPWDQRLCAVPDGDLFTAIATATPRWSPTASPPSPRRHPARVRQRSRRRHHRHRNRFEPQLLRRDDADGGRRAGRRRRDRRLPGHDAVGRAQLRVRLRLHQLVLDAEDRPAVRVLLPPAGPHGRPWLRHRASRAVADPGMATRPLLDFAAGYVQRPSPDTEAGPGRAVADVDELLRRPGAATRRRCRRREPALLF